MQRTKSAVCYLAFFFSILSSFQSFYLQVFGKSKRIHALSAILKNSKNGKRVRQFALGMWIILTFKWFMLHSYCLVCTSIFLDTIVFSQFLNTIVFSQILDTIDFLSQFFDTIIFFPQFLHTIIFSKFLNTFGFSKFLETIVFFIVS